MSLNLSTEQMAGVMEVLTVELAPLEALEQERRERLAKDRARKFHGNIQGNSTEIPRKQSGKSSENPRLARVEDNKIPSTNLDNKNLPLSPSRAVSPSEPDGFGQFWAVYPKRDGAMDRKSAVKAFGAALKRASLTTIIEGAEHFAEAMTHRGKVGTEFVPQPRTWLNGDRWNDRYETAAAADTKEAQWLAILQKHAAPSRS